MAVTWWRPGSVAFMLDLLCAGEHPRDERAGGFDFVGVDGVTHARIAAELDDRAHALEHVARFLDPLERHVRIGIAGAKKHRRLLKTARIIARRARRADQAAGKRDDRAVRSRMSGGVFAGETRALREP